MSVGIGSGLVGITVVDSGDVSLVFSGVESSLTLDGLESTLLLSTFEERAGKRALAQKGGGSVGGIVALAALLSGRYCDGTKGSGSIGDGLMDGLYEGRATLGAAELSTMDGA